jgi:hypothetical protein
MSDGAQWKHLVDTLRQNNLGAQHTVTAVDNVILPDWDETSCPWCREGRILDDIIEANPDSVSKAMQERANLLRSSAGAGLVDNVFLDGIDTPPMALGLNSTFVGVPTSQAIVAASVASALQEMRTAEDESIRLVPDGFPVRTVLTIADLDRYTDAILRSAILRSASAGELRRSHEREEKKRTDWARKVILKSDEPERQMRRELLLAILMEKLPRGSLDAASLAALRNEGFSELVDLIESDTL